MKIDMLKHAPFIQNYEIRREPERELCDQSAEHPVACLTYQPIVGMMPPDLEVCKCHQDGDNHGTCDVQTGPQRIKSGAGMAQKDAQHNLEEDEIGRASCRERVKNAAGGERQ